ncbi:Fe-S cluster assembly ATPase SufC [Patescibacteria group bacterium]|nr:Fe-S cluster assembly ATPase SufC [Patescibacteria group bacterium]MBU1016306.1 Fe-S cluster assembly ATPase SufC [Patescibacteria group bacterium]MBU1685582.1 Fe-S cluster assembly ATPase SufC [Patescibacteria group bacterium]MBU1938507.1 Fe-S cluster assembly ATPase SufC [Patescibacteria group bacterium]
MTQLLEIKDLEVAIDNKTILKGVNLTIKEGEVHTLMGPNGSGKSTLSNVIMGHPKYQVTSGDILYKGKNILKMEPHERALIGIFLAFQYPKEITGVTLEEFLLAAYRAKQAHTDPDKPPILVFRFKKMLREVMAEFKMPEDFAERFLNHGFSGGEKKKAEALQMAVLQPTLAIMDETDSGLDVDALKTITANIDKVMRKREKTGVLLVTHYQRILKHLEPDYVHVMKNGRIIKSGGPELAHELEEKGYEHL